MSSPEEVAEEVKPAQFLESFTVDASLNSPDLSFIKTVAEGQQKNMSAPEGIGIQQEGQLSSSISVFKKADGSYYGIVRTDRTGTEEDDTLTSAGTTVPLTERQYGMLVASTVTEKDESEK